ncbi:MAG TPA: dTMP kinase [Burkholderiaceae bacterium]|nr:dTMP kinase [Burkholderiaceae bacterium]
MRGRFITLEGIDGAGKSTQAQFVADRLRASGADLVVTREPGGTRLGEALRELILHQPMAASTETLLLFAARAEHLAAVIEPALSAGRWVLCDRFTDATFAYQAGGRGVPAERIEALEQWLHPDLQPDLTLLFDVAPAVAAARVAGARTRDRFETEQRDFFTRVRDAYLERARRCAHRFVIVNGALPADDVRRFLDDTLTTWLKR